MEDSTKNKKNLTTYRYSDPLKSLWLMMSSWNVPDWMKLTVAQSLSHLVVFWGSNMLLFFVAKYQLFSQYKLQKEVYKKKGLVRAAFWSAVQYDIIGSPVISYIFERILRLRTTTTTTTTTRRAKKKNEEEEKETTRGWSGLRFDGNHLPSLWTNIWQIAIGYFGYDLMFYISHRLLHSSLLYQRFHKQHHEFVSPIGLSSSYNSALEGAIQMFNWYLPIGFAGWLNRHNGGLHISSLFWYNCFRWIETVDAHSGYIFPFSPFHYFQLFGGAKAHDIHHSMVYTNFGASNIWDTVFGTMSA